MNTQLQALTGWLSGLAPRERRMVTWGGLATLVLLFLGLGVVPLYAAAHQAKQRVEQKRNDLNWMRGVAGELRAAGPGVPGAGGNGDQPLVVTVDQTAQQAGLGKALSGAQPSGTGGIRVRLEGAAFDTVIAWLSMLEQQYGLGVESATVDRSGGPGIVNASIVFKTAG